MDLVWLIVIMVNFIEGGVHCRYGVFLLYK